MMAIRLALAREQKLIERLCKSAEDPVSAGAFRQRLDRLERLRETFAPGCKILIPFESDPPSVSAGSGR